jgi:plasmid maintenance system antidote protein VapI
MGNLSNFERGEIVDARLAEASLNKSATLLGVSRATLSEVMSTYVKTTSVTKDSERKSTMRERDVVH